MTRLRARIRPNWRDSKKNGGAFMGGGGVTIEPSRAARGCQGVCLDKPASDVSFPGGQEVMGETEATADGSEAVMGTRGAGPAQSRLPELVSKPLWAAWATCPCLFSWAFTRRMGRQPMPRGFETGSEHRS